MSWVPLNPELIIPDTRYVELLFMSSFVYMNYYVTPIKPGDVFLLKTTCGHPPPTLDFSLDGKLIDEWVRAQDGSRPKSKTHPGLSI